MPYETELRLKVRLTRKLANSLNNIDLTSFQEGDCIDVPPADARILILEEWAELVDPAPIETTVGTALPPVGEKPCETDPDPY